ncbi:outer membrane protein RatA [Salmonella enterica subsp. enterica]|nr:outer membrane protein RatA [Salmonella enterica subsp. enterica]
MNKVVHFLLTLLIMFAVSIAPAQALLKGGTWQELNSVTGAVNGTAPLADGAIIPLYQGSTLLDPSKTHDIEFSAMPRDFSADATSTSMRAVNSTDTEGDLFSDPPTIAWENRQPPAMGPGMGRCRHARHAALAAAGSEPDLLRPKPRRATAGGLGAGGR